MNTRPDTNDDLDWLAFRYVAEELSADEAAAFEGRLADDQAAREAVAVAVELAQAIASPTPSVIPMPARHSFPTTHHSPLTTHASSRRRWVQPLVWMAVGAAACLTIMLLRGGLFRGGNESTGAGVLATLWANSELRHEQGDSWNADLLAGSEDTLMATTEFESDSDIVAPDWLLRALLGDEELQRPDANWEDS